MPHDHQRSVEVEALLRWCYQDELPKRDLSSADSIWDQIAEYGARGGIDAGHGAAQRYPHHGVPHPDALVIEKAVSALPDGSIDWQLDGEAIMGDLLALADPRAWAGAAAEAAAAGGADAVAAGAAATC